MKTNKNGFTQIPNSILNDENLTLEEKALLSIIMSNHEDWKIYQKEIECRSKNGRDSHAKLFKKLAEKGYIVRVINSKEEDKNLKTGTGMFVKQDIYWKLSNPLESTSDWKPVTGNQSLETSNQFSVSNNTNTDNTKEENKKEDNINGYGYDVTTTDFQLFEKAEEKQVEQSLNTTPSISYLNKIECPISHLNGKLITTEEESNSIFEFIGKKFTEKKEELGEETYRLQFKGLASKLKKGGMKNFKGEIVDNWLYYTNNIIKGIISKKLNFIQVEYKSQSISKPTSSSISSFNFNNELMHYVKNSLTTSIEKESYMQFGSSLELAIANSIQPFVKELGQDSFISLINDLLNKNELITPSSIKNALQSKQMGNFETTEERGYVYGKR